MGESSKVRPLKNDYYDAHQPYAQAKQVYLAQRKRFLRWVKVSGIVVVLVTLVCGYNIFQANQQVAKLHQKTTVVKKQLNQQKTTNATLKEELKLVNNTTYLQQLARQKYYYSKSNETIYSLPSDKTQAVTAN